MLFNDFNRADLAVCDRRLDRHLTFLTFDRRRVFAVFQRLAHIEAIRGRRFLLKQGSVEQVGCRFHGIAFRQGVRHCSTACNPSEGDRAHDAGAAGNELAPDAAGAFACRVQTRNDVAAFIQNMRLRVDRNAAQRHHNQRF